PFGAAGEDGATHAWTSALQSQGAQDQTRLAALLGARNWPALVPDGGGTFLASAGSGAAHASAALSADGRLALAYTPGSALTLALSKLAGPTTARWYDPTAGSFTAIAGSPFANSGSHTFMTPGKNAAGDPDWVLVLEAN
ncbi:MAG TPA: putative collagen-binding domain-containing protein, partial [Polyangia bacterium]|nr:putative collagen-binding domain-containing protein [Polyangia bacterium]